jgi:hypothetical protein
MSHEAPDIYLVFLGIIDKQSRIVKSGRSYCWPVTAIFIEQKTPIISPIKRALLP